MIRYSYAVIQVFLLIWTTRKRADMLKFIYKKESGVPLIVKKIAISMIIVVAQCGSGIRFQGTDPERCPCGTGD